jgi:hypothetical protein
MNLYEIFLYTENFQITQQKSGYILDIAQGWIHLSSLQFTVITCFYFRIIRR